MITRSDAKTTAEFAAIRSRALESGGIRNAVHSVATTESQSLFAQVRGARGVIASAMPVHGLIQLFCDFGRTFGSLFQFRYEPGAAGNRRGEASRSVVGRASISGFWS